MTLEQRNELLVQALIDALIQVRDVEADGEDWYQLAVEALKQSGYDEYGNPLPFNPPT